MSKINLKNKLLLEGRDLEVSEMEGGVEGEVVLSKIDVYFANGAEEW